MDILVKMQEIVKALEAGSYDAKPSSLVQGAALQVEDISPTITNVTFQDQHIKLQKMVPSEPCKSQLAQWDRQLSYGAFGGSAQLEGNLGREHTGDYVRAVVPMCYYSHFRRNTLAAGMVQTVDGVKAKERAAKDAAMKLAADIEFDLFRGRSDFSNAGTFDGNPLAQPMEMANIMGLDTQVRQSDDILSTHDLMFDEFGSDESMVVASDGTLTQSVIEDLALRSSLNHGSADKLVVSPRVMATYNKIGFNKERIMLAGSPQDATGVELRRQWTSSGTVQVEASNFLRGKQRVARPVSGAPSVPAAPSAALGSVVNTSFLNGEAYVYYVSAENEVGESQLSPVNSGTSTLDADGKSIILTISATTGARWYNVYRSGAGQTGVANSRFIGRVKATSLGGGATFTDLNNRRPGASTGFLIQGDSMEIRELAPFSRADLAVTDLSTPEAYFRFCTLAVMAPRFNVLLDNLSDVF